MKFEIVVNAAHVPEVYYEATLQHYRDVLGTNAPEAERMVPILGEDEVLHVAREGSETVGGFVVRPIQDGIRAVRFRGFMVFPAFRGKGQAREMIAQLERVGAEEAVRASRDWVRVRSIIYPLGSEFGRFMTKTGFAHVLHETYTAEQSPWEKRAAEMYEAKGIPMADLVVFHRAVARDRT